MGWAEKRRNVEGGSRWQHLTEAKPTPRSDMLSPGWVFPAQSTQAEERRAQGQDRKLKAPGS